MEDEHRARRHFAMHPLEELLQLWYALRVGAGLVADASVREPAQQVRAAQYLQAAVLAGRRVKGHEGAHETRENEALVIPVAVILMPLPGAAGVGLLQHH